MSAHFHVSLKEMDAVVGLSETPTCKSVLADVWSRRPKTSNVVGTDTVSDLLDVESIRVNDVSPLVYVSGAYVTLRSLTVQVGNAHRAGHRGARGSASG